jgi:hypothetical protein
MHTISIRPHSCWICGKVVDLSQCNVDEHGSAVHEDCYIAKLALGGHVQVPKTLAVRSADSQEKSRELIEQTKELLRQSKAIVEKKYRSGWD